MRRTGRHGDGSHERSGVFVRHHGGRGDVHQPDEERDGGSDEAEGEHGALDEGQDAFLVALQNAFVAVVEGIHELASRETDDTEDGNHDKEDGDDGVAFKVESSENHAEDGNRDENHGDAGVQDATDGFRIAVEEGLSGSLVGNSHAFFE